MTAPFGRAVPGNRWDLLDGEQPTTLPTVSVIVPYFRQQRELDRTLAALARQSYPADLLEVVVVDDGSPKTPTVPDGVVLVRQEDLGFRLAAARNLGIRSSHGDVLCFLDADTAPEPEYVARLTRLVALVPEAVTVGRRRHADFTGASVTEPVEVAGPAGQLPEPSWLQNAYDRSHDLLDSDDRSYRYVIGAVIACSRWFVEQVGGFDERFREYGGEDWEWAHRAWVGGAVFAHVPDAVAWHDGPEWSGRSDDDPGRRVTKNAETLALADAIPVRESRGRAIRSVADDVVVRLLSAGSDARAYVCVDTVLRALPTARVVVPDEVAPVFAADQRVIGSADHDRSVENARLPPRVTVTIERPVRIDEPGDLVEAVDTVGLGTLGSVHFDDVEGAALVRVVSNRAGRRRARWTDDELFSTRRQQSAWRPLDEEPGLAAYLGGWG
ncbi:glycosyltransferase family 2 protein [Curtobacterium sp. Leaf261]|uniref:glycosyltransferase family 2 protein n=1 Tax=Curtobacterium sp. Leaf261 TaxID=1736311 RepID=UPI0007018278|nr:glycosyltransferase [Curtobacterium sp. Leaf261]KQO63533.1 glycosyltransferase [Curtobacterium sp. Leaf261]